MTHPFLFSQERESICPCEDLHMNFHSSFISNSQNWKHPQMSRQEFSWANAASASIFWPGGLQGPSCCSRGPVSPSLRVLVWSLLPSPAPAHGPSHYSTIKYSTIILEVELLGFHLLLRGPREFFPLHSRFQPQKEKYLRQRDFPKHPDFPLRRWQPSLVYGFRPTLPTPCK